MLALASSLLLLLLCDSPGLVAPINNEGSALLLFKRSITQDPYGSLSNWNSSDETPCLWIGIACQEKKIVSVSIPKKKLLGFLPPSTLGALLKLRHLNLRNNRLHGNLPLDMFKPPGLQSLVLFGNSFSGSIPNEIGDLKYLQILDLSQNFFFGLIPKSLIRCERLRVVVLSQNNLTGSIPKGFGTSLRSVETLNLSFNMLSGSIPSDMGNLSSLQGTVDFSHNRFNGSIPASLGNLPEKVYIDLTYNDLSGSIPQNGALINRGPTAFIGNPHLCGPPLKVECLSDLNPSLPKNSTTDDDNDGNGDNDDNKNHDSSRGGISKSVLIVIIVCDLVGIIAVGLLFSCCYSRVCGYYGVKDETDEVGEKLRTGYYFCFRKYDESETPSENAEKQQPKHELVSLDQNMSFDLDELLKASAFVLGKSGIGIVYKVVLEDGLNLVVRRLGEGGSQMFKEFQTEIEAIAKLRHPNIVTLRAYYWSLEEKLLIYDYLPNGNLFSAIHGQGGGAPFTPLPWSVRLRIIKGIARGLAYIHESSPKKYVHGDLKPTNILLTQNMEPQISNFGLLRLANLAAPTSPPSHSNPTAGSTLPRQMSSSASESEPPAASYQAPEVPKTGKASQRWDVYSFGVILLEMITGRLAVVQVGSVEMSLVRWIQMCVEEKKPVGEVLDADMGEDGEDEVVSVLKIAMACVNGYAERRPAMRHVADALERLCIS